MGYEDNGLSNDILYVCGPDGEPIALFDAEGNLPKITLSTDNEDAELAIMEAWHPLP